MCISNSLRVCPRRGHGGSEKLGGKTEEPAWQILQAFLSLSSGSRGAKPPSFFINNYWPMAELAFRKQGGEIQISWQILRPVDHSLK